MKISSIMSNITEQSLPRLEPSALLILNNGQKKGRESLFWQNKKTTD